MTIRDNVADILRDLPEGVELVAAAKKRKPEEVLEAVEAGVRIVGENYVQEAEEAYACIGRKAEWHFIGHLQKNKVRKAVRLFDMIQTVDSVPLAREISRRCVQIGKVIPVLLEVNIGGEPQKSGLKPESIPGVLREVSVLTGIRVKGLMTIEPRLETPEAARPYFIRMRELFERLKEPALPGVEMRFLSMGMTSTYRIAIEEGANMVRIGTRIFGS